MFYIPTWFTFKHKFDDRDLSEKNEKLRGLSLDKQLSLLGVDSKITDYILV